MFESAVIKLTVWYVAALLIVVVLFSLPFFSFASNKLDRATVRQGELLRARPGRIIDETRLSDFADQRQALVSQERSELLQQMVIVDIGIIILGAIASYFFAKRTLMPIQEAHEAQGRFTADASHELRTPLAVMQTEIEVALRDKNANKKVLQETLTSNLEEIARLRILSDQLLALTKVGTNALSYETFSLSKATKKRISELEKQHGLLIEDEVEPNISVTGDRHLIIEVLTILANNAVQYSGKNPKIVVSLTKDKSSLRLTVSDNGQGIKPDEIENIFERFYRGSNGDMQKSGHGLGLSLAQEIARKSGGDLAVTSQVGVGSVFTLTLPRA